MEDNINQPKHYKRGKIEVTDFIIDQKLDFLLGNVIKYICRHPDKNGLEDLKKSHWYIARKIASIERPEIKSANLFPDLECCVCRDELYDFNFAQLGRNRYHIECLQVGCKPLEFCKCKRPSLVEHIGHCRKCTKWLKPSCDYCHGELTKKDLVRVVNNSKIYHWDCSYDTDDQNGT